MRIEHIFNNTLPSKYKKVDPYLIRGASPSVPDLFKLKKAGVTQIYDFRHRGPFGAKFIERYLSKALGIKYQRMPFSFLYHQLPSLNDFENVAKSVKQNGEQGGITLFHCNSGRHRTAQMAGFYYLTRGETLAEYRKTHCFQYRGRVLEMMCNQIYDADYFNRKPKNEHTLNPILNLLNTRNNRIVEAVKYAQKKYYELFV